MHIETIDWLIIAGYFAVTIGIGVAVARRAGQDSSQFFLSGRGMPWWLLGFSMVATTFSTDTPNLVTDIVRTSGVAGNWVWWAFLLTGMLTVFVYARLWRRSGVLTDVEFYEVRYSGKPAAFLRGFRALYLGVFLNVVIMASVSLAAIKIGGVLMGLSPVQSILAASLATVVFSAMGGLRSVILTDFLLFILAMIGAFVAAGVALDQPGVGGLRGLVENPALQDKLRLVPEFGGDSDAAREMLVAVFVIPLAVQWWSAWYPGAEPGGGGYMAQRMLAARDESAAQGAALFFNVAHYALRPWPWIIVALASLVVFPELDDLRRQFPQIPEDKIGHDLAYSAMLTFIPSGWLGIVLASLAAAYMSTISTHLNWGASYVVNDFYKRFVRPEAGEKELVAAGRIATVLMMVLAGVLALALKNAKGAFDLIIGLGAGTGLVYILRWLWWRVSAVSEIAAMFTCMAVVLYFGVVDPDSGLKGWQVFLLNVGVTTIVWIAATLVTRPTDERTLDSFCRLVRPPGPGWRPVYRRAEQAGNPLPESAPGESLPRGIIRMVLGCLTVYGLLLGTGCWIYGWTGTAVVLTIVAVGGAAALVAGWRRNASREDLR